MKRAKKKPGKKRVKKPPPRPKATFTTDADEVAALKMRVNALDDGLQGYPVLYRFLSEKELAVQEEIRELPPEQLSAGIVRSARRVDAAVKRKHSDPAQQGTTGRPKCPAIQLAYKLRSTDPPTPWPGVFSTPAIRSVMDKNIAGNKKLSEGSEKRRIKRGVEQKFRKRKNELESNGEGEKKMP